jgi:hypothetical protein
MPSQPTDASQSVFRAEVLADDGRYFEALQLIEHVHTDPRAAAIRLQVLVARYELTRALREGAIALSAAERIGDQRTTARIHLHLANAAWSLDRREEFRAHLLQAEASHRDPTDLILAERLLEARSFADDQTSVIVDHGSLESRFKAVRTLVRRGAYREALQMLDAPLAQRIGVGIRESLLVAIGGVDELALDIERFPWLCALQGVTRLEPEAVLQLAALEPPSESRRARSIWFLSLAWAQLRTHQVEASLFDVLRANVGVFETDLRLWYSFLLLALAAHDLEGVRVHLASLAGFVLDIVRLSQEVVASSPVLERVRWSLPEAYCVMHALFPAHAAFRAAPLLVVGARGVSVNGVLRVRATRVRDVALGVDTDPVVNRGARAVARHRFKVLRNALGNPAVVDARGVRLVLQALSDERCDWAQVARAFERLHDLEA